MWQHLLRPLGAPAPPASQHDAVTTYLRLRADRERRDGETVPRDRGAAVITRMQAARLLPAQTAGDPC
jgi:hypothetical protein